jgi:4-amino-4-deoxy-L-arabinose transferase-like glycosyltransferase
MPEALQTSEVVTASTRRGEGGLRGFLAFQPAGVTAPWRIFWVGFALRVLYMTVAHTWRIRVLMDHFQFGWELGRIARSVVAGQGYGNPFLGHTGPTTWIPPLYTLLVAAVFRVFGIYSAPSAWVIFAINSAFSGATALCVYEIAARCYGGRVALWSGWLWALYPAAMQYAVHWVWDMSLTTWLFAGVLLLALRARGVDVTHTAEGDGHRLQRWGWFGLLWGLILLSNPSLVLALPAVMLWMIWGGRGTAFTLEHAVRGAVLAMAVMAVCLAPWVWRNWQVFHVFTPTRGNLGAELYQSTLESNDGFPWGPTLPMAEADPQMRRYAAIGEVAYVREQGAAAKERIRENPRRIVGWMGKRVYFFWAGVPHPLDRKPWVEYTREVNFGFLSVTGWLGLLLSLRRRVPGSKLFLATFVFVPLIYYAVTVQARFRHPLEPLICVLTVYLFQSADRTRIWTWSPKRLVERDEAVA